jgi:hypothetical protein
MISTRKLVFEEHYISRKQADQELTGLCNKLQEQKKQLDEARKLFVDQPTVKQLINTNINIYSINN